MNKRTVERSRLLDSIEGMIALGTVAAPWGIGLTVVAAGMIVSNVELIPAVSKDTVFVMIVALFSPLMVLAAMVMLVRIVRVLVDIDTDDRSQPRDRNGRFTKVIKPNGRGEELWIRADKTAVKQALEEDA